MAVVMPFAGIRYNPQKVRDLSQVITPPYDVISPQEQERYHQLNDHNVIRLVLGAEHPNDDDRNNWFGRAAHYFEKWQAQGVLVRDPEPGFYAYDIEYRLENGSLVNRMGLIAVVKLEDFGSGSIRPHETTYTATNSQRLKLIKSCRANFSPIWSLFSDPEDHVGHVISPVTQRRPTVEFTDEEGVVHRMWRITEPRILAQVHHAFLDKELIIADGHHRYNSALRYYKHLNENSRLDISSKSPAFAMMYLSSMESKGLTILPAHRLVSSWPDTLGLKEFIDRISPLFEVQTFPFNGSDREQKRTMLSETLKQRGVKTNAVGMAFQGENKYFLLTLKDRAQADREMETMQDELRRLDVVVLKELVLMGAIGLKEEDLDNENTVRHSASFPRALDCVDNGQCMAAFLLNPTPVEQMRRVAQASLIMPRKSTYFFPKVITGLVFNPLNAEETITLP